MKHNEVDWGDMEKSIEVFNDMLGLKKGFNMPKPPHDRGVHRPSDPDKPRAVSHAGRDTRTHSKEKQWAASGQASMPSIHRAIAREAIGRAKEKHKQVISEQRSMPKPKLPG